MSLDAVSGLPLGVVVSSCHDTNRQQRDGEHQRDAEQHCRRRAPTFDDYFGFMEYGNQHLRNICQERQLKGEVSRTLGSRAPARRRRARDAAGKGWWVDAEVARRRTGR